MKRREGEVLQHSYYTLEKVVIANDYNNIIVVVINKNHAEFSIRLPDFACWIILYAKCSFMKYLVPNGYSIHLLVSVSL